MAGVKAVSSSGPFDDEVVDSVPFESLRRVGSGCLTPKDGSAIT